MRERAWKYWKRALAVLVAMILIFEALPLSALAAAGRDNYIPLVSSEDEEEEEDYTEDAELLDDRPLLAAGISPRAFRASGSPRPMSPSDRRPAVIRPGRARSKMGQLRPEITI